MLLFRRLFSEWIPAFRLRQGFGGLVAGMTALLWAATAYAEQQEQLVHATLMADQSVIVAGQPFHAAVVLQTKEGWHTYWENPGDAGMATEFIWSLPAGFSAGNIEWPTPKRLSEGTLSTFSYEGDTFLPVTITPPESLDEAQSYPLKLHASWLVCKDICIPESAELSLEVKASKASQDSAQAELFSTHEQDTPIVSDTKGTVRREDKHLIFSVPMSVFPSNGISFVDFFLRQQNLVRYVPSPTFSIQDNVLMISLEAAEGKIDGPVSGIVKIGNGDDYTAAFDITFDASTAIVAPKQQPSQNYFYVLLLAVMGGLVLNLMPCVLPVLSLKALAIAKKSGRHHSHVVRHGVAYTIGILLSFAVIAGVLIALRNAGEAVGWGYQMQSPAFVGFLIYLLFMVGLSLSGYLPLPVLLGGVGNGISTEPSARGSFFTGVLATAVATPCTAPFMASAVGIALTLPAWQALLIFEALGFGLALPFLLISLFPALRRFLPKQGPWMERFKQFLALPMYASVVWLLWVLTMQTSVWGMALALAGMVAIAVIVWMKSLFAQGSSYYRLIAFVAYVAIFAVSLPAMGRITFVERDHPVAEGIRTADYTPQALADLRSAGKPVLVDVTAAWCLTCQINAKTSIYTKRTMDAMREGGVTLMTADWTRRNDEITALLSEFGFKGVPLVVFYPANGSTPKVLPQILTEEKVINSLKE